MEKIEPKIGEEIEIEGMKLICVQDDNCHKCALLKDIDCGHIKCKNYLREDLENVIFILKDTQ